MEKKFLAFLKGTGTIIIYLLTATLCGIIFGKYYYHQNQIISTIFQLLLYLILLLVLGLIYHKRLINDFKNFKKEYVNVALKNWLIGYGVMIILNIIASFFVKDTATNEAINRNLIANYPLSSFISMVILAPLIEEITFRASFKNAFSKWYTFAITTGLIFGFAHVASLNWQELLFLLPYSSLGFFFAKAFYETDNIYTSYLAHVFHNGLCVILLLLLGAMV